ncbi:hypothetical protein ACJMK2_009645, partial [Sinanodonta woodiana]
SGLEKRSSYFYIHWYHRFWTGEEIQLFLYALVPQILDWRIDPVIFICTGTTYSGLEKRSSYFYIHWYQILDWRRDPVISIFTVTTDSGLEKRSTYLYIHWYQILDWRRDPVISIFTVTTDSGLEKRSSYFYIHCYHRFWTGEEIQLFIYPLVPQILDWRRDPVISLCTHTKISHGGSI